MANIRHSVPLADSNAAIIPLVGVIVVAVTLSVPFIVFSDCREMEFRLGSGVGSCWTLRGCTFAAAAIVILWYSLPTRFKAGSCFACCIKPEHRDQAQGSGGELGHSLYEADPDVERPGLNTFDVFISHATVDESHNIFKVVRPHFTASGKTVYNPTTNLSHVEKINAAAMQKAVESSRLVVAAMSDAFFESTWCEAEIAAAKAAGIKVIPVFSGDDQPSKVIDKWVKQYRPHNTFGYMFKENARDVLNKQNPGSVDKTLAYLASLVGSSAAAPMPASGGGTVGFCGECGAGYPTGMQFCGSCGSANRQNPTKPCLVHGTTYVSCVCVCRIHVQCSLKSTKRFL